MQCPACENQLSPMEAGGVTVDICKGGCGGIWFDNYEFEKFDEPHEAAGEALIGIQKNPATQPDKTSKHPCPKCEGVVMQRHFVSVKHQVEIDECPMCGGIWLDAGELGDTRGLYNSEEERKKAAAAYFNDVFATDLLNMRTESQEKLARAKKFANMFKFITPSYYIPGKQEGGAF